MASKTFPLLMSMMVALLLFQLCCTVQLLPTEPVQLLPTEPVTTSSDGHLRAELEFDWINKQLLGPQIFGQAICTVCGCFENPVDCPSWFTTKQIQESVDYMELHAQVLAPYVKDSLDHRALLARTECTTTSTGIVSSGGWCLVPNEMGDTLSYKDFAFQIPHHHTAASPRLVRELSSMIEQEGVKSINDFGAGVGQYKAEILKKHQHRLDFYNAYDGAGNVETYTQGFVKYADLTYPLALPKADWVLSLEVGEHVPSRHEGMLIRNLHRHNCKGIIVSWAKLGQGGHGHINNHSNDYVIEVMAQLGYRYDSEMSNRLRNPEDNHYWFVGSTMVFRRNTIRC